MRMRKKKNLDARMERCAPVWIKMPEEYKGKWRTLMPQATEVRLELGCGKGKFTCQTAAQNLDKLFVAVERVPDAMVVGMELAVAMGLTNVYFIDGDAAVLSHYFMPEEIDLIYINFCDPWPGNKHVRRRLTHLEMLKGYRNVLRDGGKIHFKTDNRNLFEWSVHQFPKAGFELSEVTRDLHKHGICEVMTGYEEKFHALGVPINRCVGTKVELGLIPLKEGLCRHLVGWEIRQVDERDYPVVLDLWKDDRELIGLCSSKGKSLEEVARSVKELPPRTRPEQKNYLGLWREGVLEAVLEYIEGYPGEGFIWIGLLLVASFKRSHGIGREIIEAFVKAAEDSGAKAIRLGCGMENNRGHGFWTARGFCDLRLSFDLEYPRHEVMVMERRLSPWMKR